MAAIYMWLPPGNLVVTTPPYPVELTENFELSVDIESITYNEYIESEYAITGHDVVSGGVEDILLIADPVESEYAILSHSVISGNIEDILLIADPEESEYRLIAHDVISGEVLDRLIRAYAPNEEFNISVDLDEITYESGT